MKTFLVTKQLGKIILQTENFIKPESVRTKEKKKNQWFVMKAVLQLLGVINPCWFRLERTPEPPQSLSVPDPSPSALCPAQLPDPAQLHFPEASKGTSQLFLHKVMARAAPLAAPPCSISYLGVWGGTLILSERKNKTPKHP